ncbi:MAG: hypothetical protein Q7R49_02425 [Candidatus Daviesbacteria bacterium]|nr:hypothetical protein [Candidatus Daviesbacteria bacterium]
MNKGIGTFFIKSGTLKLMPKNGFASLPLIIILTLMVVGGVLFVGREKFISPENDTKEIVKETRQEENSQDFKKYNHGDGERGSRAGENPYFSGVPCKSNPKVQFTNDFTEVDKIKSVEPTIITPGNSRHRAWLNISSGKVAVYAPVDSELIRGVYKNARGAIDYDLHFQVSCEIWYLINHVIEPVDKIKSAFPETPQTDTKTNAPFKETIKVKAGELLGYSTGTPLAHNFDFGVFDLNHFNEGLPTDEDSKYGKEANFICPFDVLPKEIKEKYYGKIIQSEKPYTNCTSL